VDGAGSSFSASSMVTLGVVVGASLLQSTVVGSFWSFVNMVQIISYIPLLKLEIPYNFQIFLTEYLSVAKVAIPFNLLPIPNPLDFLKAFITDSLGENFSICGYETFSFIYNFGQELTTWICIFGFYLVLCFFDRILPDNSFILIRRWKKDYEYNAVIRILIETNMNLVFCAFLNIWVAYPTNFARKLSLAGACLASFLSFGFLARSFWLVERPLKVLRSKAFKERYGNIVEDLIVRKKHLVARYYYPIYLIRRIIYAVVLIVLYEYPKIQMGLIIFVTTGPMFLYLCIVRPFKNFTSNILNIANEGIVVICFSSIGILNMETFKSNTIMNVGWMLISLVLLSLGTSWFVMLPGATKELINTVKELIFGKAQSTSSNIIDNQKNKMQQDISGTSYIKNQNESAIDLKNELTDSKKKNQDEIQKNEEITSRPKKAKPNSKSKFKKVVKNN